MDVFGLGRQFKVDELHVLPPTETDILHEGLQEGLSAAFSECQRPCNDRVEDIRLLNAARNVEEFDKRVKILDIVDAGRFGQLKRYEGHASSLHWSSRKNPS